MSSDSDLKLIQKFAADIEEHFDSVQIFVTKQVDEMDHNDGGPGTVNISYGLGNWFSRYGHVISWIKKEDERALLDVRKDELL